MNPILIDIVPDRSATFTATVVIAGIAIVLLVLILLILVFYLFGKTVSASERKAKKSSAKTAKKENSTMKVDRTITIPTAAPAVSVEPGISGEVVAAIAAAVAMTDGAGATVKSVCTKRKVNVVNVGSRNPWAAAAIADNTRPF